MLSTVQNNIPNRLAHFKSTLVLSETYLVRFLDVSSYSRITFYSFPSSFLSQKCATSICKAVVSLQASYSISSSSLCHSAIRIASTWLAMSTSSFRGPALASSTGERNSVRSGRQRGTARQVSTKQKTLTLNSEFSHHSLYRLLHITTVCFLRDHTAEGRTRTA
jgi:hypothetical protein